MKENHQKSVKLLNNSSNNENNQVNYKKSSTSKEEDVQKEVVNWLKKQSDQKNLNNSYSTGVKRKLNGRPVRKIKKPKFLDDSSSSSSEEEMNNQIELIEEDSCAQLIWKKKRAALELHAKESSITTSYKKIDQIINHSDYNQEDVNQSLNYSLDEVILNKSHSSSIDEHESSFQEDEIYDDRLVGALALIELSKSRPIVEYSSEVDLSDVNDYTVSEFCNNGEYVNEVHVEHCSDYFASSQGDLNYSDIHYSYNEEYY